MLSSIILGTCSLIDSSYLTLACTIDHHSETTYRRASAGFGAKIWTDDGRTEGQKRKPLSFLSKSRSSRRVEGGSARNSNSQHHHVFLSAKKLLPPPHYQQTQFDWAFLQLPSSIVISSQRSVGKPSSNIIFTGVVEFRCL